MIRDFVPFCDFQVILCDKRQVTTEGILPFVCDSGILLSRLQLVSIECDTVKEVYSRFHQRSTMPCLWSDKRRKVLS